MKDGPAHGAFLAEGPGRRRPWEQNARRRKRFRGCPPRGPAGPARRPTVRPAQARGRPGPWRRGGRRGAGAPGTGSSSALDWNRTNDTGFRRAVLYPLSYEGVRPLDRQGRSGPDTDTSIQGAGPYYALGMSSAPSAAPAAAFIPDTASTRQYIGAWSVLSVLQYFAAEAAVIGAWAGPAAVRPADRLHQRPGRASTAASMTAATCVRRCTG